MAFYDIDLSGAPTSFAGTGEIVMPSVKAKTISL
jgi:hypothetical protein